MQNSAVRCTAVSAGGLRADAVQRRVSALPGDLLVWTPLRGSSGCSPFFLLVLRIVDIDVVACADAFGHVAEWWTGDERLQPA